MLTVNTPNTTIRGYSGPGITVTADGVSLIECRVEDADLAGIRVLNAKNVSIVDCDVTKSGSTGISLAYAQDCAIINCRVWNNGLDSTGDRGGIGVSRECSHILVRGNWLCNNGPVNVDCAAEIGCSRAEFVIIEDNTIMQARQGGIALALRGSQSVIRRNLISGAGWCPDPNTVTNKFAPIWLGGQDSLIEHVSITENIFLNTGQYATGCIACHSAGVRWIVVQNNKTSDSIPMTVFGSKCEKETWYVI